LSDEGCSKTQKLNFLGSHKRKEAKESLPCNTFPSIHRFSWRDQPILVSLVAPSLSNTGFPDFVKNFLAFTKICFVAAQTACSLFP
jgi:hypothetical protein